jgi:putative ABC transport system permease protein
MPDIDRYVRERLESLALPAERKAEIMEEIAEHMRSAYQDALDLGATEADALACAESPFVPWEDFRRNTERATDLRPHDLRPADRKVLPSHPDAGRGIGSMVTTVAQELRFTLRRLRRAPGHAFVLLLTLATGIGATTAIFSVVKGVLLDPLPFEEPDRLVSIWASAPGIGGDLLPQSLAMNATIEDHARSFEEAGVWEPRVRSVDLGDGPEEVTAIRVTHGTLPTLGVQPALGRIFTFEDTQTGSPETVILSHGFWTDRFGSDPGVLGQTLLLGGSPGEIIGVMPEGFRIMDRDAALYYPLRYTRASLTLSNFVYFGIGRLAPGVSVQEATAELQRLIPRAAEEYPGGLTAETLAEIEASPVLHFLEDEMLGGVRDVLWVVFGGALILLVVACTNAANLILVRAESRERSLAVQSAMGSPRGRVALHFLTEGLVLGVAGGVVGIALAWGALGVLRAGDPGNLPRLQEVGLEPGVIVFLFGISVASGLVLGLLPLLRFWGLNVASALKEGGRGAGGGLAGHRLRNALSVAQLGLAMVCLVGAGLMVRTYVALTTQRPGFSRPEEVLTFRVSVERAQEPDGERVPQVFEALARSLSDLPGVESVGLSTSVPMGDDYGYDPVYAEDVPLPEGQQPPIRRFKYIGGGYHEAVGNPVIAGRALEWRDIHNRAPVAMVTEGMARELWGDAAKAIGRRISVEPDGDWREVIGVVGDVRDDGMEKPVVDIVYWPMAIAGYLGNELFLQRTMMVVVRGPRVGAPEFLGQVKSTVQTLLPGEPLARVATMKEIEERSLARTSFALVMISLAAGLTLLLGCVGVYGVISYAVRQRTFELGLRISMGAEAGDVIAMVLKQGMVLGIVGVGVGLGAALGAGRLLQSILFGVESTDPATLASMGVVLLLVVLGATYLPARRAARADPMVALRAE